MMNAISIQVQHLQKKLNNTLALRDVSLLFEANKMHGIIGPEGAGKTTLMRVLMGLLKPNAGTIEYYENNTILPFGTIRPYITYMPQQPSLYPDLSIDEHLDFFKKLYQIPEEHYEQRRQELLNITQLAPFVNRLAGELSGGMTKKLGLMCALLRSPRVMLLDEPTNGVDPISRREFWELLYQLMDQKILILITTAYMDEAERCSMVHLLEAGRTIAEGEPRALLEKEHMQNFDEFFLKHQAQHED